MRVFIDCHQLKIDHDPVDDEVKLIINKAIEAANQMIPQEFTVFRQVGAVRDGKMRMEIQLPFTLEKFEFDTHLEADAENFLEDALTALKFERTDGKKIMMDIVLGDLKSAADISMQAQPRDLQVSEHLNDMPGIGDLGDALVTLTTDACFQEEWLHTLDDVLGYKPIELLQHHSGINVLIARVQEIENELERQQHREIDDG